MNTREGFRDDAGEGAGEDDLRLGLIQHPNNQHCRFAYGRTLTSVGLVTDARAELSRVIAKADSDQLKEDASHFLLTRLPPVDIPEPAQRLNNKGWGFLFRQDNPDRAIPLFEEAIGLEPRFTWAWSNLASAYIDKKEYAKAIESARRAIGISPSYRNGYRSLARALGESEQFLESAAIWERVAKLDKTDPDPERQIAWMYMNASPVDNIENLKIAKSHLDRALVLEPDDQWTQKNIALMEATFLFTEKDWIGAETFAKKALEIDPNFNEAIRIMGTITDELGRSDEAINLYEKVLNVNPNDSWIRARRDQLKAKMDAR
jgi:superkiller protein 3